MARKGSINVPFVLRPIGYLGADQNRYVASVDRYSTIEYKEIVSYAARASHVPESDINMAMDALFDAFSYFVCNGHGVKLPNLGIFNFGINAKATIMSGEAGADAVKRTKLNFLPNKELRDVLDNVAITTSPMNPNGLEESLATETKVIGLYLKRGGKTEKLANYSMVQVDRSCKLVLRMSGPMAFTPVLAEYHTTEGGAVGFEGQWVGSSVVYDIGSLMVKDVEYLASILIHMDEEGDKHLDYLFSHPYRSVGLVCGLSFAGIDVDYNDADYDEGAISLVNIPAEKLGNMQMKLIGPNLNKTISGFHIYFNGSEDEATPVFKSTGLNFAYIEIPSDVRKIHIEGKVWHDWEIASDASGVQVPIVTSLSANGVTVTNGKTSTIDEGKSYTFTLKGKNLNKLSLSPSLFGGDVVTEGSKVEVISVTDDEILFTLRNAVAGHFEVYSDEDHKIFSVTLQKYEASASAPAITSIGGVTRGGLLYVQPGVDTELNIVGTNLTALTKDNFSLGAGTIVEVTNTSATAAKVKVRTTTSTSNALRYTINGSVIFQMTLTSSNEGGGVIDGDMIMW